MLMNGKKNILTMPEYWIFSFLWLLVMLPKPIQFVMFLTIAGVLLYKYRFRIPIDRVSVLMMALFVVHIGAIFHNIAVISGPTDRIIPAFNNALVWTITAIFYVIYKKRTEVNLDYIGKCCCFNLGVLFVGALATIYLYYVKHIPSFYILGNTLYETTYLQGIPETKFIGLNDFSNMNLFYIMLMMCLSMKYIRKQKRSFQVLMLLISAIEVFLIHSRSGMILFTASIVFVFMDLLSKKYKKLFWFLLCMLSALFVLVEFNDIKALLINKIIYGNESSTSFRILLLSTSIDEVWNQSPILGMGLKRYLYVGYPLGSHSSYVGFFYKTGLIGLLIGMSIFGVANWNWLKKKKRNSDINTITLFLLSFVVLFAIEDVDGTNWSSILYFSSLAIVSNIKKSGGSYENKSIGDIPATIS